MIDKTWNVPNIWWRPHETDAFVVLDGDVAADGAPPAWTAWNGHWGPGDATGPPNALRPSSVNSCGWDPSINRLGRHWANVTYPDAVVQMKAYRKGPLNPGVSPAWTDGLPGGPV